MTATTPAATPPKRRPSRNTATRRAGRRVRVTTSHRCGAALPNSPKTGVNTTGNGFHDGPPDKAERDLGVGDLLSPVDPGPGVGARHPREHEHADQREHEAHADDRRHRVIEGAAGQRVARPARRGFGRSRGRCHRLVRADHEGDTVQSAGLVGLAQRGSADGSCSVGNLSRRRSAREVHQPSPGVTRRPQCLFHDEHLHRRQGFRVAALRGRDGRTARRVRRHGRHALPQRGGVAGALHREGQGRHRGRRRAGRDADRR